MNPFQGVCVQNPCITSLKVLLVEATLSETPRKLTETKGIEFSSTCDISWQMPERGKFPWQQFLKECCGINRLDEVSESRGSAAPPASTSPVQFLHAKAPRGSLFRSPRRHWRAGQVGLQFRAHSCLPAVLIFEGISEEEAFLVHWTLNVLPFKREKERWLCLEAFRSLS